MMKKFDKELLAAFLVGIAVILLSLLLPNKSYGNVGWYQKPVQCASIQEVNDLMAERKQVPLFAGVGAVRIENNPYTHPFIAFTGPHDGSWHVVEYNIPGGQACVIGVGDQIDFTAPDWYEETFKGLQQ